MGMFRRQPPDVGHEQHDALLIAQYAARDLLPAEQVAQAHALVRSCAACASLAADLGAISNAVGAEPVPRRRRDFRIDAETAAELRGSPLTRLLRRLSMPASAPLRPLAAGVMSIGLVFVIAGNVVPTAEESVSLVPGAAIEAPALQETVDNAANDPAVVGASGETRAQDLDAQDRDDTSVPNRQSLNGSLASPPAVGSDLGSKRVRAEVGVSGDANASEPLVEALEDSRNEATVGQLDELDGLAEQPGGASEVEAASSGPTAGFADDLTPGAPAESELVGGREENARKATIADEIVDEGTGAGDETLMSFGSPFPERANDGSFAAGALASDDVQAGLEAASEAELPADAAVVAATDGVGAVEFRTSAEPTDDATDMLIGFGIALIVAGFLALLLLWFARRANPDPLRT